MRLAFRSVFLALAPVVSLAAAVSSAVPPAVPSPPMAVKLFVRDPGPCRVTFETIGPLGWPAGLPSSSIVLTQRGVEVPIAIEDGGDGRFDPGDALVFVADRLAGEHGYFNEYSAFNVYRLTATAGASGRRFTPLDAVEAPPVGLSSPWQRRIRIEQDALLLRYPNQGIADDDLWYWTKLSPLDPAPFETEVDLADLESGAGAPLRITVELRGWSRPAQKPAADFADHRVELLWDGALLAAGEWNGYEQPFHLVVTDLPAGAASPGRHRVGLRVPNRSAGASGDAFVDVAVLNWIEIVAPVRSRLEAGPARRLEPLGWMPDAPRSEGGSPRRVTVAAGSEVDLFSASGAAAHLKAPPAGDRPFDLPSSDASPIWAVSPVDYGRVDGVEVDTPSSLRSTERQADYLVVAHPKLLEVVRPLVEAHRRRGLHVELVDVRDIYDEWNDGILSPRAIRDFVAFAFHSWRRPAPRFLLLVGDASWDGKNDRAFDESPDWAFRLTDRAGFIKNGSTPYGNAVARNLLPAWDYGTHEGHAAGDNGFVAVDGEDELPDLAVGRFPVTEPAEVEAIVAKTVAYLDAPPLGEWRSRVLWVTNEERYWQQSSDAIAAQVAARGFGSRKVYPPPEIPPAGQDQAKLRAAFDEGALLVHFVGHGGRYIWRTGPPDLATQRDLFDLKDVEQLAPNRRLPLVMSLTCYSAPFDHPTADSIGEKLLRQPGRGAVGVFAASWRNSPSEVWSRRLVDELLAPGTVGEALMRVKRALRGDDFVRQYNLLGDPALELALPKEKIDIALSRSADGLPRAHVRLPDGFAGRIAVEWVDGVGNRITADERAIEAPLLDLQPGDLGSPLRGAIALRLYAWDDGRGRDALGGAALAAMAPAAEGEENGQAGEKETKHE